ncbi:hypothetical protein VZT92_005794 [Zoarces viviparus]|uniref:BEN domain-containing protein n=1 Tax=Zoarces viviparus TaxID=48416 RepID=A0AAW1FMW2_ZOAVI
MKPGWDTWPDSSHHINLLQLVAVQKMLNYFTPQLRGQHVMLRSGHFNRVQSSTCPCYCSSGESGHHMVPAPCITSGGRPVTRPAHGSASSSTLRPLTAKCGAAPHDWTKHPEHRDAITTSTQPSSCCCSWRRDIHHFFILKTRSANLAERTRRGGGEEERGGGDERRREDEEGRRRRREEERGRGGEEGRRREEEHAMAGSTVTVSKRAFLRLHRSHMTLICQELAALVFTKEVLVLSTLTGKVGPPKRQLDVAKVQATTDAVIQEFPQTSASDVRAVIRRKCNNEQFNQKKGT